MSNNNKSITDMPYAQWLEETLRDISTMPVEGIAILGVLKGGETYTAYYNVPMADKLLLSGLINQDATLDMLAAQGVIKYADEEKKIEDSEEDE